MPFYNFSTTNTDNNLYRTSLLLDHQELGYIVYDARACIYDIFVDQHYRQQGLATRLVRYIESHLGLVAEPLPPISDLGQLLFSSLKTDALALLQHYFAH